MYQIVGPVYSRMSDLVGLSTLLAQGSMFLRLRLGLAAFALGKTGSLLHGQKGSVLGLHVSQSHSHNSRAIVSAFSPGMAKPFRHVVHENHSILVTFVGQREF